MDKMELTLTVLLVILAAITLWSVTIGGASYIG